MRLVVVSMTLLLLLLSCASSVSARMGPDVRTLPDGTKCGCADASLCTPVTRKHDKEVFAFSVNSSEWPLYDWTRLTTVVQYGTALEPAWDMYCQAHKKQVRVVLGVPISDDITNRTYRLDWVSSVMDAVLKYNLDGVNVDFENPIPKDAQGERDALNALMTELGERMRPTVKGGGQLTFDVAWRPPGIDGRWYDYTALVYLTDFVVIMDYDARSQVFDVSQGCFGGANAPMSSAVDGVEEFLALYNDSSKFVLGVPWYGITYACLNPYEGPNTKCNIGWTSPPWRGCNCSDASGTPTNYKSLHRLAENEPIPDHFNYTLIGNLTVNLTGSWARQNYHKVGGSAPFYSAWFDTPATLRTKYQVAKTNNLRGLSMWNINSLSSSMTAEGIQERKEMWEAMDVYLH